LGIGIRARVWTNVGAFAKKSSLGIEVLSRDRREIRKIDRWVMELPRAGKSKNRSLGNRIRARVD